MSRSSCHMFLAAFVLALGVVSVPALADAFRVKADSTAATPDGASWDTAYKDIQSAIDTASAAGGGEVWVAKGTYTAAASPVLTMKGNVLIYGGFAGTETSRDARDASSNTTIIDGASSYQCVIGANNATLDGFAIQNGKASNGGGMYNASCSGLSVSNCTFTRNMATSNGGGLYNTSSSPTLTGCTFTSNTASGGGGMYNTSSSSPTVTDCAFIGNAVSSSTGGGGIYGDAAFTVTNCTFTGNTAPHYGGGIRSTSTLVATGCTFIRNTAATDGGGICNNGPSTKVSNCVFSQNTTTGDSSWYGGGGLCNTGSAVVIANCTFTKNTATGAGGGLYSISTLTAMNCSFSGNTAATNGGGLYSSSTITATNCIFWGDSAPSGGSEIYNSSSTPTVTYSCVAGGYSGSGNISADPQFGCAADGKLWLRTGSPCMDAGTATGAPNTDIRGVTRPQGGGVDMGAYEMDDTDGDGISDIWEQTYFGNLSTATATSDSDADGVTDLNECLHGTNPTAVDTDVDGISDADEIREGWDPTITTRLRLVSVSNTSGTQDGLSWATAFTAIQDAVDAVRSADEGVVWVAAGTYVSGTDPVVTLQPNVRIYGGFVGTEVSQLARDWKSHSTFIDGGGARRCVIGATNAALNGFTVQNGKATNGGGMYNVSCLGLAVSNCAFITNAATSSGGGMYNSAFPPVLTDCTFTNNTATASGGGLYNSSSSPTLTNCTFASNTTAGAGSTSGGGGMYNDSSSSPTVTTCTFTGNQALSGVGGGIYSGGALAPSNCTFTTNSASNGGGIYSNSTLMATTCHFTENTASSCGGGLYNTGSSTALTGCVFAKNTATSSFGGGAYSTVNITATACTFIENAALSTTLGGGGIYLGGGSSSLVNCLFVRNTSACNGGGLYNASSTPTLKNCTFSANTADAGKGGNGGAIYNDPSSSVTVLDGILWGDSGYVFSGREICDTSAVSTVTYSCVAGGRVGAGNIAGDPLFADATNGDFRLQLTSPCIDAGAAAGAPSTDILGTPRPRGSVVDMGAYEAAGVKVLLGTRFLKGIVPILADRDSSVDFTSTLRLTLAGSETPVLSLDNTVLSGEYVLDTTVYSDGKYSLYLEITQTGDAASAGSQTYDVYIINNPNVSVHSGTIATNETWAAGVVHIVSGKLIIASDACVTIEPGTVVKFNEGASIQVATGGCLTANGAAGTPIVFTSFSDDSVGGDTNMDGASSSPSQGDWGSIGGSGTITLNDNAELRYTPLVRYVKVGSSGDGTSWDSAFGSIQDAVNAAASRGGGEVWVAAGSYTAVSAPVVTMIADVDIYGGFAGTETSRDARDCTDNVTVVDGQSARYCVNGISGARIDGFTIQNGSATNGGGMYNTNASPTVANCIFSTNAASSSGGGMYNTNSSAPVVINCTFKSNASTVSGAGMYNTNSSAPALTNCAFTANTAKGYGGGMYNTNSSAPQLANCTFTDNLVTTGYGGGGGMYNGTSSAPVLTNCTFTGNRASQHGGLRVASGGGLYNSYCSPFLTNCKFTRNLASTLGGGIYNSSSTPTLNGCIFKQNSAEYNGGGLYNSSSSPTLTKCVFHENTAKGGGGLYNNISSSPALTNCVFWGNTAACGGGALYNDSSSSPKLFNCTVSQNAAATGGGLYNNSSSSPTISNCILWGDWTTSSGDEIYNSSSTPVVTYSCVKGGYAGSGNFSSDPIFVGVANSTWSLGTGSPCIDTGTGAGAPSTDIGGVARPQGAGVDIGAYEVDDTDGDNISDTWEQTYFGNLTTATATSDSDGDVVTDVNEYLYGTNPIVADTDGDGFSDADEIQRGSDPTIRTIVLRVDGANNSGTRDGLSWATAFTTIQSAVDAVLGATDGEVWVAAGTYASATDPVVTLRPNVHVYGGFAGAETLRKARDWKSNSTFIDGGGARRCVVGANDAALDGFTVQNGKSTYGGGMYNVACSGLTLSNCVFTGNMASSSGGAMYNASCTGLRVSDTTFSVNAATSNGGGMYNTLSSAALTDCTFTNNTATSSGGGLYDSAALPVLTNCTFVKNRSSSNTDGFGGGAMHNIFSSPLLTNCVFCQNAAVTGGGVYNNQSSSPMLRNCTFSQNAVSSVGGGLYNKYSDSCATITNSVMWGDLAASSGSEIYSPNSTPVVTYSCVLGGWTGTGNISSDPHFVDADDGDLRLKLVSTCIDAGTSSGAPSTDILGATRPRGAGVDMGAYEAIGIKVFLNTTFLQGVVPMVADRDPNVDFTYTLRLTPAGSDVPVLNLDNILLPSEYDLDTTAYADGKYTLYWQVTQTDDATVTDSQTCTVYIVNKANVLVHSGTITANETWAAGVVHVVSGKLIIASGACVTIEPGAVVKLDEGGSIQVAAGGCLTANGTADAPIVFTSIADDSLGGDTNMDGTLSLPAQNDWGGIGGSGTITLNDFAELRYLPVNHSGTLSGSQLWRGRVVHHVTGNLTVPSGVTLTILPGAIVKFDAAVSLTVALGGTLFADGRLALPIVFTSIKDDAYGGDTNADGGATTPGYGNWLGLRISGSASFTHCMVSYAGTTASGSWDETAGNISLLSGATATVDSCVVAHSTYEGIGSHQTGLVVNNSVVYDCDRGVSAYIGSVTLNNCVVDGTRWALNLHGAAATLNNCSITAFTERGVFVCCGSSSSNVIVNHCNVWNPTGFAGSLYSGIGDQTGTNGDISVNPLYYDRENGDFTFRAGSPLIDAADGAIAPESDFNGAPRVDDPHMPNTGTSTPTGAYADIGAFESADDAKSDVDLVVQWVRGPVSAQVGDTITLSYDVVNLGTKTAVGPWRDSLFLKSADPAMGAREVALGETTQPITLAPNTAATLSATVTLPAAQPGAWHLGVRANAHRDVFEGVYTANNEMLSTATMTASMPSLTLDTSQTGTLDGGNSAAFVLAQAAGQPLTLLFSGGSGMVVYIGFGSVPSATNHSLMVTPGQPIVLPAGSAGRNVYIVVQNTGSNAANYSVTPTAYAFRLVGIGAYQGSDLSTAVVPLLGAGFAGGMQALLQPAGGGASIPASSVAVTGTSNAQAIFNLSGAAAGVYDVTVQLNSDSSTLPSAFTVIHNAVARLEAKLTMPPSVRAMRKYVAWLEYSNDGDGDMNAPYFTISSASTGVLLSLSEDAPYQSGSLEVLGLGANHPVSILRAGESGRIPIYFRTPAGLNGGVNLKFTIAKDDSAAVPWDEIGANIRPTHISDEAWMHILGNLSGQMGMTWSEMIGTLRYDADYLSQFNQSTGIVKRLFDFEMLKARGALGGGSVLSSMSDLGRDSRKLSLTLSRSYPIDLQNRFATGIFGRGWVTNFGYSLDTTELPSALYVVSPSGTYRSFSSEEGAWKAAEGDMATLAATSGGYVMTEKNGVAYTFTSAGLLASISEPNGNTLSFQYSGPQLTSISHSDGQSITLQYSGGHVVQAQDDVGRTTTYAYDSSGVFLSSVTLPNGQTFSYAYSTDAGTSYTGSLSAVTYSDGTVQHFTYDQYGRLASACWDEGVALNSFTYPGGGAVDIAVEAGAYHQFYGEYGQLLASSDPLRRRVSLAYDSKTYALTSIQNPDGTAVTVTNDRYGRPVSGTDQLGNTTEFGYVDAFGSLAWFLDARGNKTSYGYNTGNNVSSITYPDSSSESWAYSGNGDALSWTNRRSQSIAYTYDAQGRLSDKTWPDGRSFAYTYDAHDNLLTAVDSITGTITMTYNDKDYMTTIAYPDGHGFTFEYDDAGRRTRRIGEDGYELHYGYDTHGRLATLKDKNDALFVSHTYDNRGRLSREDRGNGTYTTYAYDAANQVFSIQHYGPDAALQQKFEYTYDLDGLRTSMITLEGTYNYTYDLTGQLTGAIYPDGSEFHYNYDPLGNRISATENGTTETYITNAMNQYTQVGSGACTYDLDGNLTQQTRTTGTTIYTYDVQNRLIGIQNPDGTVWSCQYDALGNRILVTDNGNTKHFVFDPIGLVDLVAEYDSGWTLTYHYIHGNGLVANETAMGARRYYDFDAMANVRLITDQSGTISDQLAYMPFGQVAAEVGMVPMFTFGGEFGVCRDRNDRVFMRNRLYLGHLARFSSQDPTGLRGWDANFYKYSNNDAMAFIDPTGLRQQKVLCTGIPYYENPIPPWLQNLSVGLNAGNDLFGSGNPEDAPNRQKDIRTGHSDEFNPADNTKYYCHEGPEPTGPTFGNPGIHKWDCGSNWDYTY